MEEMNFMWKKLDSLPKDTDVWTGPANVEGRSWTSSSLRGGSVLGFPQYGSSCLWKDDDLRIVSFCLFCVQPKLCNGKVHARVQNKSAFS